MSDKDKDFYFNMGKLVLAGFLFIGYYVLLGVGMVIAIPATSAQFVASGIAVLGPIVGLVAGNMFPKGTEKDKDTISELSRQVGAQTQKADAATVVAVTTPECKDCPPDDKK